MKSLFSVTSSSLVWLSTLCLVPEVTNSILDFQVEMEAGTALILSVTYSMAWEAECEQGCVSSLSREQGRLRLSPSGLPVVEPGRGSMNRARQQVSAILVTRNPGVYYSVWSNFIWHSFDLLHEFLFSNLESSPQLFSTFPPPPPPLLLLFHLSFLLGYV